jgi:putative isomerase
MFKHTLVIALVFLCFWSCKKTTKAYNTPSYESLKYSDNILDYRITPKDSSDKSGLMYSDQGAWFAYGLADSIASQAGFSGPYLLTQQNGIWASKSLASLNIRDANNTQIIDWKTSLQSQNSYASHLEQSFKNEVLEVKQELVFLSGHTSLQKTSITNLTSKGVSLHASISGELFDVGISVSSRDETILLSSNNSSAKGYLKVLDESVSEMTRDNHYNIHFDTIFLKPNESKEIKVSQTFIFPEYSWGNEESLIERSNFDSILKARKSEKESQLEALANNKKEIFSEEMYSKVLAKALLTLQNNWRIPAGEIKHSGLFPSYHYKWFNGFWSWDSWKHAVGLVYYDTDLAKEQVRLMFNFQNDDGFVADCVFRDTLIEKHNYRDTKPPLSAWAVVKIYEKDKDLKFVKDLYPKLKKYHEWWYANRDNDQDGLCEFGSSDGSLIAAKWESGMDNAIRFDNSKIVKNSDGAFSLNQESVDLNAYLFAEKIFLATLADALKIPQDANKLRKESETLKAKIQTQFYDENDGWFYDTNLEGNVFIKGEGSEGWTPLWANAVSQEQAEAVKNKMMNPNKFFTKVPFQTMSADHEKFNPLKGYWRGPNWLDQAYFGVKGLRNYGFIEEADKAAIQIIKGAEGILEKGKPIRENYHPHTGEGQYAKNFSWSAAHIIMLLMKD